MAKYGVEISDEMSVELDVAPGAPVLRRVTLEWDAPEGGLAEALERFGGAAGRGAFAQTAERTWVRVHVPLTRDGEPVGMALLRVRALAEEPPEKPPDPHNAGVAPGGGRW